LPPVEQEVPETHFRPLGRWLLSRGKMPILVAPKTPRVELMPSVPRETTKEYGSISQMLRDAMDVTGLVYQVGGLPVLRVRHLLRI
jgi:hypothetical protein